jgi:hypothetical protein
MLRFFIPAALHDAPTKVINLIKTCCSENKKIHGESNEFILFFRDKKEQIMEWKEREGSESKHQRQQSRYAKWKIQFFSSFSYALLSTSNTHIQSPLSHLHHVKQAS